MVVDELERFLTFARDRLAETDEPLPCGPEEFAAVMIWLCALGPEFRLASQTEADNGVERRAERKRALVDGFRRARGVAPIGDGNDNGNNSNNGDNDDADASRRNRPTEVA